MRILSGIQPSGNLHLGNYFGAIAQFLKRQNSGDELFIFIADWHALTTIHNAENLKQKTFEIATAYLAFGLDPEKTTLYRQSDIPEIMELAWILACQTPLGLLERAHSFKDKKEKGLEANAGLFTYPILMAADILALNAEIVPIGKDQKQHLEIARDLAQKFNHVYGETLFPPEPEIPENVATVPGTDGQKMSKSYGNTIDIFAEEKTLKKQVMGIVTDSTPKGSPLNPDKCNVFALFKLMTNEAEIKDLAEKYKTGAVGYGDAKKILLEKILNFFGPARQKFTELQNNPDEIKTILESGGKKARAEAQKTLTIVRKKIGLIH